MSIENLSVLVGGSVAASGGTATSLISKGAANNPHRLVLDDGAEFSDLTKFSFSVKEPKISLGAPNGYTQARNNLFIAKPLPLDNGGRTVNTFKGEFSWDIETTDAEKLELRVEAAQLIIAAALDDYYNKQSTA